MALIIADMILMLIKIADDLPDGWILLPYLTIPSSYILARTLFFFFPFEFSNSISLLIMICSTVIVVIFLLKHKTNKFKTKVDMKKLEKIEEDKIGSVYLCASLGIIFSIFALLGGLLAIQGKQFKIVTSCAVLGTLSLGFYIGSILSIIALFLILRSRDEFVMSDENEDI